MDVLTKMLEENHGAPLCDLPVERQADYLRAVARQGAIDALQAIGLHDENAAADIQDIRDLLRGLRVLKRAAWTGTITAVGRIVGWGAVLALAALFMNGKNSRDIAAIINP